MIKNRYFFLILLVMFLLIKYNFNDFIEYPVLSFTNEVKTKYIYIIDSIQNSIQKHINQEKTIQRLKEEVKELKKEAFLTSAFAGKLRSLLKDTNITYSPDMTLTRAISYVNMANYNRVWLDFKEAKKDKIYGLISRGYTAGIALRKKDKMMGLMQGDEKCIFSVYIGKDKLPGVIFGNKDNMVVRYIPSWMSVKIGDEVYTSGLDGIFYEGVKVGKVVDVVKEESYINALVKPYANTILPGFFYIVTKP